MNDEERAKRKRELLENWWVLTTFDLVSIMFVFAFNLMIGLIGKMEMGQALLMALVTCMIWIPLVHIIGYLIVKKWG